MGAGGTSCREEQEEHLGTPDWGGQGRWKRNSCLYSL